MKDNTRAKRPASQMAGNMKAPSFKGHFPKDENATKAAIGSSKKRDTQCEIVLRRELWRRGLRFTVHVSSLFGVPDVVFSRWRVAVFCDGDFWHGRDIQARLERLRVGHNPDYWEIKIRRNYQRDCDVTRLLERDGWYVVRLWETDVLRDVRVEADKVVAALARRRAPLRDYRSLAR